MRLVNAEDLRVEIERKKGELEEREAKEQRIGVESTRFSDEDQVLAYPKIKEKTLKSQNKAKIA